jgi:hypothetical protein
MKTYSLSPDNAYLWSRLLHALSLRRASVSVGGIRYQTPEALRVAVRELDIDALPIELADTSTEPPIRVGDAVSALIPYANGATRHTGTVTATYESAAGRYYLVAYADPTTDSKGLDWVHARGVVRP